MPVCDYANIASSLITDTIYALTIFNRISPNIKLIANTVHLLAGKNVKSNEMQIPCSPFIYCPQITNDWWVSYKQQQGIILNINVHYLIPRTCYSNFNKFTIL